MRIKTLFFALLVFLTATTAFAQKQHITSFSRENLPNEMLTYLDQGTSDKEKKQDNAKLIMSFAMVYKQMDADMQQRLTGICNVVLKLKVRQLPDVYNFISTVNLMHGKGGQENFEQWISCIEFIQGRNKKMS